MRKLLVLMVACAVPFASALAADKDEERRSPKPYEPVKNLMDIKNDADKRNADYEKLRRESERSERLQEERRREREEKERKKK